MTAIEKLEFTREAFENCLELGMILTEEDYEYYIDEIDELAEEVADEEFGTIW